MREEKGYTLLELVVTVGLLISLSTVIALNATGSRTQIKLANSAKLLESALTQAQAYGMSGKAFPEGDTSPEAFDRGYGVYIENGSGVIIIYGGQGDTNSDGVIDSNEERYVPGNEYETIPFEGGVFIEDIAGSNAHAAHVFFRRGETGAHLHRESPDVDNANEIILKLSIEGNEVDVVVNKTGLIYIND